MAFGVDRDEGNATRPELAGQRSEPLAVGCEHRAAVGGEDDHRQRVRAHDGSLDLVCTQERILKIFRITGLTKVFGIHDTVDLAIAAKKSEK